jgi:hypothetical protein
MGLPVARQQCAVGRFRLRRTDYKKPLLRGGITFYHDNIINILLEITKRTEPDIIHGKHEQLA